MINEAPLRVILVGRSPLADTLRRDEGIELIRSQTPMDALGELSVARNENAEAEAAVLVADDMDPGHDASEFAAAARSIAPGVTLLRINDAPESPADPWDGNVPLETSEANIARFLRRRREAAAPPRPTEKPQPTASDTGADTDRADASRGFEKIAAALLTGRDAVDAAVDAIRAELGALNAEYVAREQSDEQSPPEGAAPVVRKNAHFGWLVAPGMAPDALRRTADRLAMWIALAEQHRQLTEAAFTDPLTGAWNRRFLHRFLNSALDRAREQRRDVTVLLFDIDDFKLYNDSFGHAAGDEILRETVKLLTSVIRPSDRVCRLGGDEFVVIFDDPEGPRTAHSHHPPSITDIAARFQRQICGHRFPKLGVEAPGTLGVSGGMATFPWDASDPESLLERADELAMESKRQGKNVITLGRGAERVCGKMPAQNDLG